MMRPVIGILPMIVEEQTAQTFRSYAYAIETGGGTPILLPYTEDAATMKHFVDLCDGFFFIGGPDVEPARYGETRKPTCGESVPERDALEFEMFRLIWPTGKPILGVCRGCQLINIALGGTLWQDIPTDVGSELTHRQEKPYNRHAHAMILEADTPLQQLLGETRIAVNSIHHQAIRTLGKGMKIMAKAPDGVIEAAYLPGERFVQVIQWHPERTIHADEYSRKIFKAFVSACQK